MPMLMKFDFVMQLVLKT